MEVPQEVMDLLMLREGWRQKVYVDTTGNATVGMGHKMLPSELHQYPEGHVVPDEMLEQWKQQDALAAYRAAKEQAMRLGSTDDRLVNALTCVSFQLGVNWYKKLFGTWALLLAHKWDEAADHEELSLWAKETPVRADDFAKALRSMSEAVAV